MKKLTLFLLIACCFCLAGCSKDAEINAFITEFDSTTTEMIQKIDSNPSAAGIDEAQKAFDGKKASLKAKWDAIKDAVGFQVSADVKKKLEDTVTKNMSALTQVSTKHMMKLAMDKDATTKFTALLKEYQGIFTPPAGSK
jgi:hypothetical protein